MIQIDSVGDRVRLRAGGGASVGAVHEIAAVFRQSFRSTYIRFNLREFNPRSGTCQLLSGEESDEDRSSRSLTGRVKAVCRPAAVLMILASQFLAGLRERNPSPIIRSESRAGLHAEESKRAMMSFFYIPCSSEITRIKRLSRVFGRLEGQRTQSQGVQECKKLFRFFAARFRSQPDASLESNRDSTENSRGGRGAWDSTSEAGKGVNNDVIW